MRNAAGLRNFLLKAIITKWTMHWLGLPHVSQANRGHVLIFCSRGFWDIWGMVVDSMASCSSFLPVEDASSYKLMQWLIFGTREEPSLLVAECRGQKIHEYSSRWCAKDLKMKMFQKKIHQCNQCNDQKMVLHEGQNREAWLVHTMRSLPSKHLIRANANGHESSFGEEQAT